MLRVDFCRVLLFFFLFFLIPCFQLHKCIIFQGFLNQRSRQSRYFSGFNSVGDRSFLFVKVWSQGQEGGKGEKDRSSGPRPVPTAQACSLHQLRPYSLSNLPCDSPAKAAWGRDVHVSMCLTYTQSLYIDVQIHQSCCTIERFQLSWHI